MSKKWFNNLIYPVIVIILVYLIWEISSYVIDNEFVLAKPILTFEKMFDFFKDGNFWSYYLGTILRALISYFISLVISYVFAIVSIFNYSVKRILNIFVSIFRSLPTMTVVLILAIWVGSDSAPLIVSFMVVMPTLYAAVINGMELISKDVIEMGKLDGSNIFQLIFYFYIPLSVDGCKNILSTSISLDLKLMVAAEIVAHKLRSLGGLMQEARNYYEIASLLSLTFITVVSSIILEKIFHEIIKKINNNILGSY